MFVTVVESAQATQCWLEQTIDCAVQQARKEKFECLGGREGNIKTYDSRLSCTQANKEPIIGVQLQRIGGG